MNVRFYILTILLMSSLLASSAKEVNSVSYMDFTDGANEVEEYAYDANGNMTMDLNRGIESITYDWNNMPREITFTSGAKTRYTYDAAGRKLRAEYITPLAAGANYALGPTPPIVPPLTLYDFSTIDYHGDCVLRNDSLERVLTPNGYIANDTLYYYIKDCQGNVRSVVRQDGAVVESNEYYPYGGLFSATASVQPYKYSSKELDRTHGLDLYDSEARWYDSLLGRTSTMDPLAEKYYSLSPYTWCAGNPIAYIDKTGKQPIFNTKGFLIGVTEDSKGLQGMPIVMKQSNFHNRMTTEEASKYNVGIDGLLNKDAKKRFNNPYKNLSKRPDWDGKLTLSEANEWYAKGGGKPLYIDIKSLDLSMFYSLGEQYVGKTYYFNLLTCGNPKDGLVYGHLGFERTPNDGVRALSDTYDFDMKKWSLSTTLRNIETIIGNFVAGKGIPFDIIIYGEQKLKSKPIWAR